jgi:dTDP-4-amino-4,6-dideoxygalactose transaminase
MAGLPCDMPAIWQIARRHGLKVVEDAAHAAGSLIGNTPIGGGASDAVAFSFYATKNLSTGEGGMVTTPHADLAERMRILCLHGISRDAWNRYAKEGNWYYEVVECGYKYNLSDIMSALGLVQLRKLERMTARRLEIAARYDQVFSAMPELEIPPARPGVRHCRHLYTLRLNLDRLTIDRAAFIEKLRSLGIGCSVHFIPIPMHPYYRRTLELRDPCRRALAEYPRLVSLPLYSGMTDQELELVIRAVREVVSASRRVFIPAASQPLIPVHA